MQTYNWQDVGALAPLIVFFLGGCALLLSEVFLRSGRRGYQVGLSVATAVVAGLLALYGAFEPDRDVFGGFARIDAFGSFITVVVAFAVALASLLAGGHLKALASERGEFHALLHFAAVGMSALAHATDLITLFVALEIMSLSTYALTAWIRSSPRPSEAALKYFVLGSFSSAIFLYGTALAFGAAGSTRIQDIGVAAQSIEGPGFLMLLASLGLMAAGFLFKVAAVPFHMWAPDVYQGAPSPIAGFMAAGVKAAAFAAMLRVLLVAFGTENLALGISDEGGGWREVAGTLAALTMIVGNLLAVTQRSVKRMLAYSSVSHAGYLLVGLTTAATSAYRESALQATLFYLAAYTATTMGAFAVVSALEKRGGRDVDDDDRYDGLAQRHPAYALAMAVFMLSLAGVPPTAGFAAKLMVFRAALDAGAVGLVVIGLLSSVVGLYYYLRVIMLMYFRPAGEGAVLSLRSSALGVGLAIAAVTTIGFGIGPGPLERFARLAAVLGG